ncbi:hypothetical protein D9M68_855120 [compost metagenome]
MARAPSSERVSGLGGVAGLGSGLGGGAAGFGGVAGGVAGCAAGGCVGAAATGGGTDVTGGGVGTDEGSVGAAPGAGVSGATAWGSLTCGWNGVLRSGTLMGMLSATGTGWESSTMGRMMTAARTSAMAPASLRRARPRSSAAWTSLGTAALLEDGAWSAGSLRLKKPMEENSLRLYGGGPPRSV